MNHQLFSPARRHYMQRKVAAMKPWMGEGGFGLDLGSGNNEYAQYIRRQHLRSVFTVDANPKYSRLWDGFHHCCDMQQLPFPNNSFDFVYAVNSIHHLPTRQAQVTALVEAARVLKPGRYFILHEMNAVKNRLLAWYLKHIFPHYSNYDNGSELWLSPHDMTPMPSCLKLVRVEVFTFTPDFIPAWLLPLVKRIETWLERTWLRQYGAHFCAVYRKGGL